MGRGAGGGAGQGRSRPLLSLLQQASVLGGKGKGGKIRPCTRCCLLTSSPTLCLSLFPFCCGDLFRYKKALWEAVHSPYRGRPTQQLRPLSCCPLGPRSLERPLLTAGGWPPAVPPSLLLRPRRPALLPEACPRLPSASPTSWVSRVSCGPRAALHLSQAPPSSPWRDPSSKPWLPLSPLLS